METIILLAPVYFALAYFVAYLGEGKTVGFDAVFLISVLLTPIAGLIVAVISKSEILERKQKQQKERQLAARKKFMLKSSESQKSQLSKLEKLRNNDIVTDAEYKRAANRLS